MGNSPRCVAPQAGRIVFLGNEPEEPRGTIMTNEYIALTLHAQMKERTRARAHRAREGMPRHPTTRRLGRPRGRGTGPQLAPAQSVRNRANGTLPEGRAA
ncbi:hypothetical protein GCM10009623_32790 [Nocardioides aestuarii]